jgi:endonuclease/exonuclease/phosphatase family metal-dependent hydrolase
MDPSKILVWNVRGLNSSVRQDSVRELVNSLRVEVVCLQETKMQIISDRFILSMLGTDFNDFIYLPFVGAAGGILVAWRRHLGFTGQKRLDNYSVSVQFCNDRGNGWWLTCVYGPQGGNEKIMFLEEIREIRAECLGPWMLAGDFNLIYKDSDRNNNNYNRAMMGRFRRLIEDMTLKEIPLHGRHYTWSNQQNVPVLVKLDRVFCSVDWELLFPNVLLQSTTSQDSDHYPLILGLRDNKSGKRRFHFESFWTKLEGFQDIVLAAWNSIESATCPFKSLEMKLQGVAKSLQAWSEKQVGHVRSQLALAKEILHMLEIAQDGRVLSPAERWLKFRLKKQALLLSSCKRSIARLRARISWLKDGDANTKLFHLHARHRKRKNFVACLVEGEQILTSHEEKAACVDQFYTMLLGNSTDRERAIELEALGMPNFDLTDLDAPISEQEV